MDDVQRLRQQLEQLQAELAEAKKRTAELEQRSRSESMGELPVVSEFEETLRRLVQRTAMIVQAEKCVIMVRERETDELYARPPAFGMNELEIRAFQIPSTKGISGLVYTTCEPRICNDTETDKLAQEEDMAKMRIRNCVTVPLLIERRDEQNRLIERINIGVLHCFNKRYNGEFIEEDVRLLERLSRNAAAVVANSQVFQEIIEEKQKLVHTLESLTAGLILVNHRGNIAQMNAQARAMFGIEDYSDPIGKPFLQIITHEECRDILKKRMETGTEPTPETEEGEQSASPDEISIFDKEETEFIYQIHAAKVRDEGNAPIGTVFIFNDITDIRNVERMKTEFVSIVSHELRTPLTPMKGFIQTLRQDTDEEWYTREDRQEFYGIIEDNVDRLSRLINDLLNVSRIEKGKGIDMQWEFVNLHKTVDDVLFVQRQRTDKHKLIVDFDPDEIVAETDPDIIQNILHNVISNAIKYSPGGGEIRIIGRILPSDETMPASVLLGVKDQGLGLPESALKRVGEKFYRPNKKGGGTGIGLFLVKALVLAHSGNFWAESDGPGKGTTFWARFPLKQEHKESDTEEQPEEAA